MSQTRKLHFIVQWVGIKIRSITVWIPMLVENLIRFKVEKKKNLIVPIFKESASWLFHGHIRLDFGLQMNKKILPHNDTEEPINQPLVIHMMTK